MSWLTKAAVAAAAVAQAGRSQRRRLRRTPPGWSSGSLAYSRSRSRAGLPSFCQDM